MSDASDKPVKAPIKAGNLSMAIGPVALAPIMSKAKTSFDVVVHAGGLRWSNSRFGSCEIGGDKIASVAQHGSAFAVGLCSKGSAETTLICSAPSRDDAAAWVVAIESLRGATPDAHDPSPSPAPPPSPAQATDPTLPPVKITWSGVDGEGRRMPSETKDYALLVIACDPLKLQSCNFTSDEQATFDKVWTYTFRTTLLEAKVDQCSWQPHVVIIAPSVLEEMDGRIYAFRNETAKQFGLDDAKKMDTNLVTVYQVYKPQDRGETLPNEAFQKKLVDGMASVTWWPFGAMVENEQKDEVYTPYFNHFRNDALREGEPWRILARQGSYRTILVHATTCFESVLNCWGYGKLLMEQEQVQRALPADKSARIAIVGAGPSGLLFARQLRKLGYLQLDILEKERRLVGTDGKTHTITMDGPYPKAPELPLGLTPTVCELGTCYLSASYADMVVDLAEYLQDNPQYDFAKPANFRGVFTDGELQPGQNEILNFGDYVQTKALVELGLPEGWTDVAKIAIALDLGLYGLIHFMFVGIDPPMPSTRPASLDGDFGHQSFQEFLEAHDVSVLIGMMQYAYQVQGYGSLNAIPAYYGLLWITPPVTWAILLDSFEWLYDFLGLEADMPLALSAFRKGWGDLWEEMIKIEQLDVHYEVNISSIWRPIDAPNAS